MKKTDGEKSRQRGFYPAGRRDGGRLALLLVFILTLLTLTACGSSDDSGVTMSQKNSLSDSVSIAVSSDLEYASAVFSSMDGDNYIVTTTASEDESAQKLMDGDCQMAILTPQKAAELFASGDSIQVLSPVFTGGFRYYGSEDKMYLGTGSVSADENSSDGTGSDSTSTGTGSSSQTSESVSAADILGDGLTTPRALDSTTINVLSDEETAMERLSDALILLDGGNADGVTTRDGVQKLHDAMTTYNNCGFVNICALKEQGLDSDLGDWDVLVDADSYWEQTTGQPLPAAVLVMTTDFAADRQADVEVLASDYNDALSGMDQPYEEGSLVFYGSSDRGTKILQNYYTIVFTGDDADLIPGSGFYYYL